MGSKTVRVREDDYETLQRIADENDMSMSEAVSETVAAASLSGALELEQEADDDEDKTFRNPETGSTFTEDDIRDPFLVDPHVKDPAIEGFDHVAKSRLELVEDE